MRVAPLVAAAAAVLGLPLVRCLCQRPAPAKAGHVALVGAGPADVGLLTVKGLRLVQAADVLVVDELVDRSIVELAPAGCKVIEMGKRGGKADSVPQEEINAVLVAECRRGQSVVRLKGGDPLVFGRVWPEMEALEAAGCAYEIVPGITSALSAAAALGIPITHKELSRHFVVVSCHKPDELDFAALAAIDTVVILMGGRTLPVICARLADAGLPATTPVAVAQWAGHPAQRSFHGTLADIVARTAQQSLAPAIIIIGQVAALAHAARHP
eukprot:EG_transcript_18187